MLKTRSHIEALTRELAALRQAQADGIAALRRDLGEDIVALRRELADDLAALRVKVRDGLSSARDAIAEQHAHARAEDAQILAELRDDVAGAHDRTAALAGRIDADGPARDRLHTTLVKLGLRIDQQAEDMRLATAALLERIEAARRQLS